MRRTTALALVGGALGIAGMAAGQQADPEGGSEEERTAEHDEPEAGEEVTAPGDAVPHAEEHEMSPEARLVPVEPDAWRSDPAYGEQDYDPDAQEAIYGDKHPNPTPRPLLELGRDLYGSGDLSEPYTFLGEKNPVTPRLTLFGDARAAVAWNDLGAQQRGVFATTLTLNLDLKITATERIHYVAQPFNDGLDVTRATFGESSNDQELVLNENPTALFFEGDLGAIVSGFSGEYTSWDMPIAAGLMPMFVQNGVWMNDAFTGFAFTFPAWYSDTFDISNADLTFFGGFDEVSTGALPGNNHDAAVGGFFAFLEMLEGYVELGYGYTGDMSARRLDYHNVTIAFTRRYGGWLSNSVRVIGNFGQDPKRGRGPKTAEGFLILLENSLITSSPLTLVPYFNFFLGFDQPQALARAANTGGVLGNTGINFASDALTGFPTLDPTARNSVGGAIGIEYLFSLDQQIVVEVAAVHALDKARRTNRFKNGGQLAVGVQYQRPFLDRFNVKVRAMGALREFRDDLAGAVIELQAKF